MIVNWFEFEMDIKSRVPRPNEEEFDHLVFKVCEHDAQDLEGHFDIFHRPGSKPKDIIIAEEVSIRQLIRLQEFLELVLKNESKKFNKEIRWRG